MNGIHRLYQPLPTIENCIQAINNVIQVAIICENGLPYRVPVYYYTNRNVNFPVNNDRWNCNKICTRLIATLDLRCRTTTLAKRPSPSVSFTEPWRHAQNRFMSEIAV